MNNKTVNPGLFNACDYLRKGLAKGTWKHGQRLPNYRTLAQQACVGRMTMLKALADIRQEKLIWYKEKSGIYAGESQPNSVLAGTSPKKLKWETVYEKLKKEILEGRFSGAEYIPSLKELGGMFHIDYSALRKAVDTLIDNGIIVCDKRRYRINLFAPAKSTRVICIVLDNVFFDSQTFSVDQLSIDDFIQSAEKECSLKNIRLVKCRFQAGFTPPVGPSELLGFIVWHTRELNNSTPPIIQALSRYKKPVAVYLYPHSPTNFLESVQKYYTSHSDFFISDLNASYRAGKEMVNFLWKKGHRKILFISDDVVSHNQAQCLAGLQEGFLQFNIPDGVVLFHRQDILDKHPNITISLVNQTLIERELTTLDTLKRIADANIDLPYVAHTSLGIQEAHAARDCLPYNLPLFTLATTLGNKLVWVCADDHTALHGAMRFLEEPGNAGFKPAGIAGFGDVPESRIRNLTTYHFDLAGTARKMISMLMYPEHAKRSLCLKGTNIFEVDGMVIDRGSA